MQKMITPARNFSITPIFSEKLLMLSARRDFTTKLFASTSHYNK